LFTDKLTQWIPWLLLPELAWRRRKGPASIRAFQDRRLRQLVEHAYARVPYYRERRDKLGLPPGAFKGLEDLDKIPVGRKADITEQEHRALLADSYSRQRLILHCTSGTSGRPLRIYRSWHEERMLQLLRLKAYLSYGWTPLKKTAKVSMPSSQAPNLPHRILSRFGLFRVRSFSCFDPPEKLIHDIAEYRPDILGGYPESLAALARTYVQSEWPAISPRYVNCGGGMLTQLARGQLHKAFPSVPVQDVYGSTEFNLVAWQCPDTSYYHVCEEGMVLEVLDQDGRPAPIGQRGQLVGTALHSFAMPILRMPLGDMVVRGPESCPCGAGFTTLQEINGRTSELFTLSGGRTIHPFLVLEPLDSLQADWLHRYRLVQIAPDHLVVELVAQPIPDNRQVALLVESISAPLPADIRVEIRFVEQMPQEESGKFRLSVPLA